MKKQNYILKINKYILVLELPPTTNIAHLISPTTCNLPHTTPHTTDKGLLWNSGNYKGIKLSIIV